MRSFRVIKGEKLKGASILDSPKKCEGNTNNPDISGFTLELGSQEDLSNPFELAVPEVSPGSV